MKLQTLSIALLVFASLAAPARAADEFSASEVEFFEKRVRPVLLRYCYECHSRRAESLQGGLLLDGRRELLQGGESGAAVIAGDPQASLLIQAINYDGYEMPPSGRLPQQVVADLERWVAEGAAWPAEAPAGAAENDLAARRVGPQEIAAGRGFWSFRPLSRPAPPAVSDPQWPRGTLDCFVLSELERAAMRQSPAASRRELIRRVYFDLIGLPPRYEEVEAFAASSSPVAYERLVDRLLASPQYGQHWARYWLDIARYAEDHPNGALPPRYAHRYRDWVVAALNDDLPYDAFVRRQLAADFVPNLPLSELAALGFWGLSPDYLIDEKFAVEVVETILADQWEERVDVLSRGLLGLTVACARCHDHKYDPITTEDYYALAGVVASTQVVEQPTVPLFREDAVNIAGLTRELRFHEKRYESRYKQRQGLIKNKEPDIYRYDKEILESASEIQRIKSLLPEEYEKIPRVTAVRDAAIRVNAEFYVVRELFSPEARFWRHLEYAAGEPRDLAVQVRGSPTRLGKVVPRRFLQVLSEDGGRPFQHGSGRGELADAILQDARSLSGRVVVNRVWGWHMGRHLVDTPSNFGQLGARPTHPALLDSLTAQFLAEGWSLKRLHREIVLSETYRQSSRGGSTNSDPDNRLYSRMQRRRLGLEAWRDAMFYAAGDLSLEIGGPSFDLDDPSGRRRALYGRVSRAQLAQVHKLFDFPEMTRHSPQRLSTTTPLQQLYYLNSPFILSRATAACRRLPGEDQVGRLFALYRSVLARQPSAAEVRRAAEFLAREYGGPEADRWKMLAQVLLASNEFLFVD